MNYVVVHNTLLKTWDYLYDCSIYVRSCFFSVCALLIFDVCVLSASSDASLPLEREEQIRLQARRRLEEQLKQYRVKRQQERVRILFLIEISSPLLIIIYIDLYIFFFIPVNSGVQPFDLPRPHWKTCFGPHIQYTNNKDS